MGSFRIADAAFLVAAVALQHQTGEGDFAKLMGQDHWPTVHVDLTSNQALFVGTLLLIAAAGKSALVPFSAGCRERWKGRHPAALCSMARYRSTWARSCFCESARFWKHPLSQWHGRGARAHHSCLRGLDGQRADRRQERAGHGIADPSRIIVAEIGLGLHYFALIHIIGHACMRSLQCSEPLPCCATIARSRTPSVGD